MSTIPRADSRRLYSWWWDSHISPKNSKWLQENLKDMDMKVKAMIKLIEEDADSFARRAEMYYKKRPELMKLVEEFYRAYRALAERYDVATGALRHAHRTMSEAFPNHIPLALPDESLSNNTSEMPSPKRALFDSEDLQKNAFGVPTHLNAFDRIGPPEENETLATRKGLRHFNETPFHQEGVGHVKLSDGNDMKGINVHEEEGTARVRLPEGKVRRSLNFKEEEENAPHAKIYIDSKSHFQTEHKEKENVRCGVKHLQEQVSQLSSENQKLKIQIELESKHLDLSRAEVQNLRDDLSKLESEKDAAFLQNQLSYENISSLEIEISKVKNEIRKLNEEMEMANLKLSSAEQQCLALEKANQSLQLELEEAKRELEELRLSLKENDQMRIEALQSSEQLYNQSNEKVLLMTLEIQILVEKLKEIERSKVGLEEEVLELKDINYTLNEHNFACALKMKHLENEIISLKEINGKLEDEIETHAESKKILQQELDSLKDDKNEIDLKHQILTKQMEAASLHIESLETLVKDLQYGHAELKECCSKLEDEKFLFLNKLNDMESVSERNSVLENSLSDANVELEQLREKIKVLEGSCESLSAAVSKHVGEKTAIAIQIEILTRNVEKLSEKNTLLENSLADANTELEGLRSKLRGLEESCQSLSHANSDLLAHKDDLISQVKSIKQSLADLETTHTTLEGKHLNLVNEKDLSVNKIMNLEDSLSAIQKEHESLINSKNICLANLENQLHLLQEDKRLREEELEAEQQRYFYHMTEIFILQRCLFDMSDSLIIGKQKYESLIQSSEIQLSALESQIHLLQEERKVRENKIEEEEKKSMNSLLEIFILQRCLSEMKGGNFTLFQECQKMLEGSRCSDELIKHLEDRDLVQKENITLLMEHISNVRYGIQRLLKPLNINKELMNIDGSEVVILPTILGEIKNLLASISDFHDAKQFNRMEILVYLTLLKQIGLEKVLLSQELEKIDRQSLVFQREHRELFDTYEKLCHDTSVKDSSNITLKAEMESLTRKLVDSLEKLYNLREEKNALEEENSVMCMEAMTLEHLYLFFRSLNAESMQQLKLFSGDMFSLLTVKNGLDEEIRGSKERERAVGNENKQLKESLVLLEELISRTTISEFDMYSAWSFCEELILQVEAGENLLKEKNMDLSKAIDMLQCKQAEFAEVCRKFEVSNKELDETKITRSELETRIAVLLEGTACKDKQIASINEENRTLNEEFSRFKVEVEALKMREQSLSFELQNEKEEFDRCEGEMMELFSEVQASVVNAAVLDEKMFELASRCESLEISAMVQKETLKEEITLKNTHAVELKKKLDDFENENEKLRTNLKVLSPLFFSLGNVISYVEEHVCQLAKLNGSQDNPSSHHQENLETSTGDHATMAGVLELQNLIAKVEALQKLVVGTKSYLDQEKLQSVTDLESARREIEELKLKESSIREEKQGKETSNMVKDIELDQVSSSCGASRIQGSESNDQMLKSWDTADMDNSNRVSTDHDIEAVEEVKSEKSLSELNVEKDVGVYKLEISREIKESQEDWNRRVIKRLAFNAEKLSALQGSAQELKLKMEKSGTSTRQNRLQFDTIEAKLKDAEAAISDLVDKNGKLAMMVEVYSNSFSGEEMGRAERSQVLEQARSQSDRIGMLELELQKIDYIFLKLEEEWESYPTGGGDRTPRVLLRDYLYGRKDRQGKKRGYFCGCMRPSTQDGH